MEKITITEALSEVNLIKKKITAKQAKITGSLTRFENQKDPYESDGGSTKMITSESQALNDLGRRLIKIRAEISRVNLENEITLGEETKSIHDWLVWKRELATASINFVKTVYTAVKNNMDSISRQPQVFKDDTGTTHLAKLISNIDYAEWIKLDEKLNEKLDILDGKLSLKNATILINV